jgi:hypothetical protein
MKSERPSSGVAGGGGAGAPGDERVQPDSLAAGEDGAADPSRRADSDAAECGRSTLASGESGAEVSAAEDSGEGALARTGVGLSVRAALLGAATEANSCSSRILSASSWRIVALSLRRGLLVSSWLVLDDARRPVWVASAAAPHSLPRLRLESPSRGLSLEEALLPQLLALDCVVELQLEKLPV